MSNVRKGNVGALRTPELPFKHVAIVVVAVTLAACAHRTVRAVLER